MVEEFSSVDPVFFERDASYLKERFAEASHALGASQEGIEKSWESILSAGELPTRYFHMVPHFNYVLKAEDSEELKWALQQYQVGDEAAQLARNIMTRAVAHHDVVYYNFDKDFATGVEEKLAPFITIETGSDGKAKITLKADSPENPVFDTALELFGLNRGDVLNPFKNQNEFLSAVYAGIRGMEAGIPPKYVLAEMAMIEGTAPWGLVDRFTDSRNKLVDLNGRLKDKLTDEEIDACMAHAVAMANQDVRGLANIKDFHAGTFTILQESGIDYTDRKKLLTGLGNYVKLFLAPKQELFASGKGAVFHQYPGLEVYQPLKDAEKDAHRSFALEQKMLESIAVATVIRKLGMRFSGLDNSEINNAFDAGKAIARRKEDNPQIQASLVEENLAIAKKVFAAFEENPNALHVVAQKIFSAPSIDSRFLHQIYEAVEDASAAHRGKALA